METGMIAVGVVMGCLGFILGAVFVLILFGWLGIEEKEEHEKQTSEKQDQILSSPYRRTVPVKH